MRLNKYISETGVCSRREADQWIAAGRVSCNGRAAVLGTQVADGDEVCLDGRLLGAKIEPVYLALNKPVGIICTTDTQIEDNIIQHVGFPQRIFPVGRLDRDSEGLILLTNDGDIVNEILRSENHHEKEYVVTVNRPITDLALRMMADGVKIMGRITQPSRVARVDAQTFRIILTQGVNRQIRRMCSALGFQAQRLQRVRIMDVHLGNLREGRWRRLTPEELAGLLPVSAAAAPAQPLPATMHARSSSARPDQRHVPPASGKNRGPG